MPSIGIDTFMQTNTLRKVFFLLIQTDNFTEKIFLRGDEKMAKYDEIQVHERPPLHQSIPLGLQHLFAMFGSTVLVPILFGVNPATILLMNGVGTLLYLFITKGKIPAYLGSSFAFISPVTVVLMQYSGIEGYSYVLGGFFIVGVVLTLVSIIIRYAGTRWIDVVF